MKIEHKNNTYQEQRATTVTGSFHSAPVIALCPGKSCSDNFLQHSDPFVCCVPGWMTSRKCILDAFSHGANMKMPGINTHQGCISYRAWTDNYSSTLCIFTRAQGGFTPSVWRNKPSFAPLKVSSELLNLSIYICRDIHLQSYLSRGKVKLGYHSLPEIKSLSN